MKKCTIIILIMVNLFIIIPNTDLIESPIEIIGSEQQNPETVKYDMVKRLYTSSTDSAEFPEETHYHGYKDDPTYRWPKCKTFFNSRYIVGTRKSNGAASYEIFIYASTTFGTWGSAKHTDTHVTELMTPPVFYVDGATIYTAYADGNDNIKIYSSADGDTWGSVTSISKGSGYNGPYDYFKLNSTRYIAVIDATTSFDFIKEDGTRYTYAATGLASVSMGCVIDNEYYFAASGGSITGTILLKFDGSSISLVETIHASNSYVSNGPSLQVLFNKNGHFVLIASDGAYSYILVKNNNVWTEIFKIERNPAADEYCFIPVYDAANNIKYIIKNTGTGNRDIYYINDGGSFIKIISTTTDVTAGWDDRLGNLVIDIMDFDVWDLRVSKSHLNATECVFEYDGIDIVQGAGLVLYNDDDELIFEGDVDEIPDEIETTTIYATSKEYYDLEETVTHTFVSKTLHEIVDYILNNFCRTLHIGTTDSPSATTYDKQFNQKTVKYIFEWLESIGVYGIRWNDEGSTDYTVITGESAQITVSDDGDKDHTRLRNVGRNYNGVMLIGGLKSNGDLAKLLMYDPKESDQQLNYVKKHVPSMIDDTNSTGHEMYDFAVQFLSNLDNSFKFINFETYEKGSVYLLKPITLTDIERSISAVEYIPFKIIYYPDENISELECYNYLFFSIKQENEELNLPQSNQERLEQLGQKVLTTGEPTGFPWECVDNPSITLSMSTDTFTMTPTGDSFYVYSKGTKFIYESAQTLDLSGYSDRDLIFIEFDTDTGLIKGSTTPWSFCDGDVFIATVYKNTKAAVTQYTISCETHYNVMDWSTHEELHESIGTLISTRNGHYVATFTASTISITAGTMHDEDLKFTHSAISNSAITIWYRDASLGWVKEDGAASRYFYKYNTGTNRIYYDNAGTLTDVANTKFVNYWIFATNATGDTGGGIIAVMGETVHNTLSLAKLETISDLSSINVPSVEYRILYRVTLKSGAAPSVEFTENLRTLGTVAGGAPSTGYTDPQAVAAVETADPLELTGDITIATTKSITFADGLKISTLSYAKARLNGAQSIPNSTATKIQFKGEDDDIGGDYDHVTNYRFVAPVDGVYAINAKTLYSTSGYWGAGEVCELYLYVNGAGVDYMDRHEMEAAQNIYMSVMGHTKVRLEAFDYLEIWTYQNCGAALSLYNATVHNYAAYLLIKEE